MKRLLWLLVCLVGVPLLPVRVMSAEPPAAQPGGSGCLTCHASLEDEEMSKAVPAWQQSVHKTAGIGCQDCHGGSPKSMVKEQAHDPNAGYIGIPDPTAVPEQCGKCHQVQRDNYIPSPHGTVGEFIPNCVDCHSDHKVVPADVVKISTPKRCGDCHTDDILDQFNGVITGVLTPIAQAKQAAADLRPAGVPVDHIDAGADLAREMFRQKVSHVFVFQTIVPRADSVKASLKKVDTDIRAARTEVSTRRKFGIVAAGFLVILAGFIWLYRRTLSE
ncbi:MAG: hypothetical protein HY710_07295 [Candidatus Latescibacteria bacterium]|nr:hypothetical protein [Candidatus Latescibacterota bacterium]